MSDDFGRNPSDRHLLRQRTADIRAALLRLHKALIESEKASFERTMGPVRSPNHLLQLLTADPWFAWLHPLSRLIVALDQALDQEEPPSAADFDALFDQSGRLLAPREHGNGFAGHYFQALQRDPQVVLAHAKAIKVLGARRMTAD